MSRRQRLTYLAIAAAIAVVAIVLALTVGGNDSDDAATAPTATATGTPDASAPDATATPTATATPDPGPLLTAGKTQEIDAKQGDTVRLRVRADSDDEVHIHGYDIEKEIPAGTTVPISFKATITGIFEIEFHSTDEQIGRLKVEPN
jgi:FtsP/CotA-like multicopper oxidase with cupredoxin domain